jgi:hypothetical protein
MIPSRAKLGRIRQAAEILIVTLTAFVVCNIMIKEYAMR